MVPVSAAFVKPLYLMAKNSGGTSSENVIPATHRVDPPPITGGGPVVGLIDQNQWTWIHIM